MSGLRSSKWANRQNLILEADLPPLGYPHEFNKPHEWLGMEHRERVLAMLVANSDRGVTTREFWRLDIHHPAGRVKELRDVGLLISTHWVRPAGCKTARLDYALYRLEARA